MGLKQKLGMGIMSAALGLLLVGGGTYAYFSDSTAVQAKSATGTLELNVDGSSSFSFENMKPSDEKDINFTLTNDGTLDIQKILLGVTNSNAGLAKYLKVKEFKLGSDNQFLITRIKDVNGNGYIDLDDLARISADDPINLRGSFNLSAPVKDVHIKIEFVDNGERQNYLQGVENNMTLNFEGIQSR
jgi:spore coat-associated protein N